MKWLVAGLVVLGALNSGCAKCKTNADCPSYTVCDPSGNCIGTGGTYQPPPEDLPDLLKPPQTDAAVPSCHTDAVKAQRLVVSDVPPGCWPPYINPGNVEQVQACIDAYGNAELTALGACVLSKCGPLGGDVTGSNNLTNPCDACTKLPCPQ